MNAFVDVLTVTEPVAIIPSVKRKLSHTAHICSHANNQEQINKVEMLDNHSPSCHSPSSIRIALRARP